MKKLTQKILSYLDYLNKDCNLYVSVHFDAKTFSLFPDYFVTGILPYNIHRVSYCVKVKTKEHYRCLQNQKNIIKKSRCDESFCHCCPAGVCEYIYPIFKDKKCVGFVAVSGYAKEKNDNDYEKKGLKNEKIPTVLLEKIIPPLSVMFEELLSGCRATVMNENSLILQYLGEYHSKVTLGDLSEKFSRSKSHISHMFKKENGMSVRAYCNILKINDAKNLLENTDLSVSDIAYDTGFEDVSYFVYMFRKETGITPLQYRKHVALTTNTEDF